MMYPLYLAVGLLIGAAAVWWIVSQELPNSQQKPTKWIEAYYARMNPMDLKLRNCSTPIQCKTQFVNHARAPTRQEARVLQAAARQADAGLLSRAHCSKVAEVPWKFAVFPKTMEGGFPHTHGDTIYVPAGKMPSAETLAHEKVHVYQRTNPRDCHDLYTRYWDMEVVGVTPDLDPRARNNPDKNGILYRMQKETAPIQGNYTQGASKLTDIDDIRDHPHEMMAYRLAALAMGQPATDPMDAALLRWATTR